MSAEQTPDIAALAARLFLADPNRPSPGPWVSLHESGQQPYLCMAQAATAVFAPVLAAAVREAKAAELRAWIAEWPTTTGDGTFLATVARDGLDRADRITEPVSHEERPAGYARALEFADDIADLMSDETPNEAATSGEEASKA